MVAALPEATTPTFTPQQAFSNVYGDIFDAEQALEVAAQEYIWRLSAPLVATGWNR
jgi:hypothetical protein